MNPPAKKPTDQAKYREQYINSLRLEASNAQRNLNANQIFKQTGQSPAPPPDNRTTTEKYGDRERLKLDIRSGLKEIADGQNVSEIMGSLNDYQLTFLAAQLPQIILDLKPKWKYGILAPIFMDYLERLINNFTRTRGVEMGLQQDTGEQILLSNQQIANSMVSQEDLGRLYQAVNGIEGIQQNRELGALVEKINRDLEVLQQILPTREDLAVINQIPENVRGTIQLQLNEALGEIPTRDQLQRELQGLNQALRNRDQESTIVILRGIEQILAQDAATSEEMDEVKREVLRAISLAQNQQYNADIPMAEAEVAPAGQQAIQESAIPTREEWRSNRIMPKERKTRFLNEVLKDGNITFKLGNITYSAQRLLPKSLSAADSTDIFLNQYLALKDQTAGEAPRMYAYGIKGSGLTNKKIRSDNGQGWKNRFEPTEIKKPKPYCSFGCYAINRDKLNDQNILMIKTTKGHCLEKFPSVKLSQPLGFVLKKIVGGALPTFNEMSSLSENDKKALHHIATHSKLDKRDILPKPDMSKAEADLNRFQILKGEIQAGNDNKQLVKEFKVMLMKFMNDHTIPLKQGRDILLEITSMGL